MALWSLKTLIGRPVISNVIYQPTNERFIPVEFSAAAYRFGHNMIRRDYQLNNPILRTSSASPTMIR